MPEEDDRQDAKKEAKEGKALMPDWGITGSHGIQEILYLESSPKRKDAE